MLPCFEKILPLVCGVLYIGLWRCWGPVTPPSSIVEVLIKEAEIDIFNVRQVEHDIIKRFASLSLA